MIKTEILKIRNDVLILLSYLGITKFNNTVLLKTTKTILDLDSLAREDKLLFLNTLGISGKNAALELYQDFIEEIKEHSEMITLQDVLEGRLLWEETQKLFHKSIYQFVFSRLYKDRTAISKEIFKRATKKIKGDISA